MFRHYIAIFLLTLASLCAISKSIAAEMTFQIVNNTEHELSLKLFSHGASGQHWPGKTRAYSVRPDAAVQRLKIECEEGEKVCWGAWVTVQTLSGPIVGPNGERSSRISTTQLGVGKNNSKPCEYCCHVCKDGTMTPPFKIGRSSAENTATK
jgi:hypothetical protein